MNNYRRRPIFCPDRTTPQKEPLRIGMIGYNHDGPAIFLHCRGHQTFHATALKQMLRTWRKMAGDNVQLTRAYLDVLNKAVRDANADLEAMVGTGITEENEASA